MLLIGPVLFAPFQQDKNIGSTRLKRYPHIHVVVAILMQQVIVILHIKVIQDEQTIIVHLVQRILDFALDQMLCETFSYVKVSE